MVNKEIAKIFLEMSALLEMKGVAFKPQAYERASFVIENLSEDISEIYKKGGTKALEDFSGIGKRMAEHIEEYLKTGKIKNYAVLKREIPVDVEGLRAVEGVGPKMIFKLYKKLRIKNRDDLEKAAKARKIRNLEGMGIKSEEKIIKGIEFLKKSGGRLILGFMMPYFRKILRDLNAVRGVEVAELAGSARRMQETVGDLDILVVSKSPKRVMDFFISMPEVESVLLNGETRSSVRLKIGIDADLRVIGPESFGAAQQYFTGDKYHNIAVREIAMQKGYKLNEYGIYKNNKLIAAKTENEIYQKLGLIWIPPEIRNNSGEIEAAINGRLPELIGYNDLKGDLQIQTDWSDGDGSIREMAEAAKKFGLEYICITDHTKSLAMTGGSDEKKLLKQMAEIDKIQKEISGIKILKGAEVNIMKDGSLDIDDETLSKLDVVGAAVHSNFNLTEEEMNARIIKAMENPNVDIIFHPTGRIINQRDAYAIDMEKILKKAMKTGTIMEIDAFPSRLDLKDEYIRKGVERGVKFSIDSDAHHVDHIQYLEYGIAQARRGWADKEDIINTQPLEKMLKLLK